MAGPAYGLDGLLAVPCHLEDPVTGITGAVTTAADPDALVGLTPDRFAVLVVLGAFILAALLAVVVMGFGR
jgi:hypothetical protein